METDRWLAFAERAHADGQLIERVIRQLYTDHLPEDGQAIDGGANLGFHTFGLAARLTRGRILAVEANRVTFAGLLARLALRPQVMPVFGALQSDANCTQIRFNCSPSHPGRSGVGRIWDLIAPGQVEYAQGDLVPATTIDRLVAHHELPRLDFIKLDLEGGEYHALRGAERALRGLRPLVVAEHSKHSPRLNGFRIEDYFAWLSSLGYVPVSPAGSDMTIADPFPFWYVFLVPEERLGWWRPRIEHAAEQHA